MPRSICFFTALIYIFIEQTGALRFELHGSYALAQQAAHMIFTHWTRCAQHPTAHAFSLTPERIQLQGTRHRVIVPQRIE